MPRRGAGPRAVFLNVPFDRAYQPLFTTLVTTLVCLGQTPRCVVEIREGIRGRLDRIYNLIQSCGTSIHDLSRIGPPARSNMPFELGLACAFALAGARHDVVVLDAVPRRLAKILSDYNGRDPLIHNNRCDDLVSCVLDLYEVANQPDPDDLRKAARLLRREAPQIAERYRRPTVFFASPFRALVAAATEHAVAEGYIPA